MDELIRITEAMKKAHKLKKRGDFFTIGTWAMMFCVFASLDSYISWYFIGLQVVFGLLGLYYIRKSIKILEEV